MNRINEQGTMGAKYPFKFEIIVDFLSEQFRDVTAFNVIRTPLNKTSSFAVIVLNLRPVQYWTIDVKLKNNQFEFLTIDIGVVDPKDTVNSIKPSRVDDLIRKTYLVIGIKKLESDNLDSAYMTVELYLINPIIYYLQTTNGFNQILEDITALEAIQKFEDFIKKSHGNKTFDFIKVGAKDNLNDHRYEQILTRQQTDLLIPNHLIMAYKPFHTFNYYFFDDFRLEKGTTTDITCFLINLGNIESFNKRSVWAENQSEISISNTLVKSDNLSDTFNELFQKKSSLIVKSYDQEFGFRKVTEKHPVMISQVTSSADNNANTSRGAAVIKTKTAINNQFDPTEQTLIYASDSIENGIKRFDLVSGQFRNRIHSLETFYMRDSHPDFLQFNHCYDISPLAMNEYDYVPLSIINSFARETEKVPIFSHHCNYQMIRFRPHNFEGGKKVGGKNFEDDPEYTNEKQSII